VSALLRVDEPQQATVSPEHASRRTFLTSVGLAGVAGLAAPLLSGTSRSAAASGGTLIYGINNENYSAFTTDNPTGFQYCYRAYDDTVWERTSDVPKTWITTNPTHFVNWSVRPNLRLLLAGKFDKQIIDLLATAPNNAELTMWHEAAALPHCGPGNAYAAYAPPHGTKGNWMTAALLRAGHAHLQNLCASHKDSAGGHVGYGQIFIGPANQHQVGSWIAPKLYWYGYDIYDNKIYWENPGVTNPAKTILNKSAIVTRMTDTKNFLDGIATGYRFHITETNSHVKQHRKNWALFLSEWMAENRGYRFEWFYHAGGKLSGPYSALEASTRRYIAERIIPVYGKRSWRWPYPRPRPERNQMLGWGRPLHAGVRSRRSRRLL
jgi:hypothetical protein